jgi:hypothetical protein
MSMAYDSDCGLAVLSRGEATGMDRTLLDPRAVMTVRYADEAAWTVATAVARALAPVREQLSLLLDRTGLIVASPHGPAATITAVGADARAGRASPLRFPAANPGSMAGVSCILFGVRGPALNLLLPPDRGVPVGWFLAARWLNREAAACMGLAATARRGPLPSVARAVLLTRRATRGSEIDPDLADARAWLAACPTE